LASIAIFAMVVMAAPVMAEPSDHEMPAEDDIFWTLFAQMTHPTDTSGCTTAVTNYVNGLGYDAERTQAELQGMLGFCTGIAGMPADMQSSMVAEGVETSLFSNSNWHSVTGLYFQKSENGLPMGRISFNQTIDFMTYRFFNFMNNFGNLVQFNDGYISLNAAMVPEMVNYGASFTMYGLDQFSEQPDIYVTAENGRQMKKAVEGVDLSDLSWNSAEKSLTFTPEHFSAFRVVQKGSKVKSMKITSVTKRNIRYNARKNDFKIKVKGRNLRKAGVGTSCTLGFEHAQAVRTSSNGKRIICTFEMADFSTLGYYPLAVSVPGIGEVTRVNAVRMR